MHCDVPLTSADMISERSDELPPISELHCIRAASASWATGLYELLSDGGIPHRIQAAGDDRAGSVRRPGHELPYGVYVRAEDLAAASAIDARHMASEIPDLPEGFDLDGSGIEGACPACGEPVAADAPECGSCGLALIGA